MVRLISQLASNIIKLLKSYLSNYICYYDGKLYYLNDPVNPVSLSNKPLVIISRQYYFEESRYYNISDKKDLQRVIQMDLPSISPYPIELSFYWYYPAEQGGFVVYYWFLNPEGCSELSSSSWMLLPETAILIMNRLKKNFTHESSKFCWQFEGDNTVAESHLIAQAVVKSSGFSGLPRKELFNLESNALLTSLIPIIKTFFDISKIKSKVDIKNNKEIKVTIKFVIIILVGYLSLSSVYLKWKESQLAYQLESTQPLLNDIFTSRRAIKQKTNRSKILIDKLTENSSISELLVFLQSKSSDYKFDLLRMSSEIQKITLLMNAFDANQFMQLLINNENVQNPEFVGPIDKGKSNTRDRFTVKFTWTKKVRELMKEESDVK